MFNLLKILQICCMLCLVVSNLAWSGCDDEILYCFDSNESNLGPIVVEKCWSWTRVSCQACNADLSKRIINFSAYMSDCQKLYPKTVFILNVKNVDYYKLKELMNVRYRG